MKPISVAVVGTGWCGGIRAETLVRHALVKELHLAETRAERLAELSTKLQPATATADYRELLKKDIQAVYISATPESTHYPMARDFLSAGKHVFLEKPIAMTLREADELIRIAKDRKLKFTIGYSQRFNPKFAYVRKCIRDATIGRPVTALVSRHITRMLGTKISGRSKLSPAAMEATHDLDFIFWCLEPAKPVRVYSQVNYGAMRDMSGGDVPDQQWLMVTMDSGMSIVVGGGWSLPLGYPNFSSTWIEMVGTEGAVMVDDSHKDVLVNTVKKGMQLPMSTMPGEFVDHTYAGPMAPETVHFLEAVVYDREVMVKPEHARMVMEVYIAADLSAERNEPVALPLRPSLEKQPRRIGLAIVGAGRVGLFRGEVAARHPMVDFIGVADLKPDRAKLVGERCKADFVTTDFAELLKRPEITAAIISTDEHLHVEPILAAVERKLDLMIEKPLATRLSESEQVLKKIQEAKVDAVVGYTQRFRRKWLSAKEKVRTGALGDVSLVTSRAFMNRLVALDNYQRTDDPSKISPMVISGTHALDIVMWMMEAKKPVEIFARSVDKALGPICGGIDATAGVIAFEDGSLYHSVISWALPVVWPGAVYSLEVGITGTEGVITIDDTHRDIVLATSVSQSEGYAPDSQRRVDFLGSYPPGDMVLGELRGPMREETEQWLNRICMRLPTQHATAAEAHNRLMLTKAFDKSARLKKPIPLPISEE